MNRFSIFISILLLTTLLLPSAASSQNLFVPGQVLVFPPGVRSYGMGLTGAADMSDLANSHFNPAIYLFSPCYCLSAQIADALPVFESDASFSSVSLSNVRKLFSNGSSNFYLAGNIRYGRLDYGEIEELTSGDEPFDYHAVEQGICLTAAGGLTALDRYHVGLGFSVKPIWSSGYEAEYLGDLNYSAVAFDLGLLLAWNTVDEDGYLIRTSLGFSLVNLGADIDTGDYKQRLPKKGRIGMSLRIETPGFEVVNELRGVETPVFTLTSSFDILYDWGDRLQQNYVFGLVPGYDIPDFPDWYPSPDDIAYMYGLEVGLFQTLFLRWGYYEDKFMPKDNVMLGLGIGAAYRNLSCGLDWARIPQLETPRYSEQGFIGFTQDHIDRFGISLGMLF